MIRAIFILIYVFFTANALAGEPAPGRLQLIRNHLDKVLASGTDTYGTDKSALWLASIDIVNGGQPEKPSPSAARWYRQINSPRGSNLYWDQALLVAAINLSEQTKAPQYKEAADAYVKAFLQRGISPNGLFLWGNHVYYDVFTDKHVYFGNTEPTHECRPHPCALELLARIAPEATERWVHQMGVQHIKNKNTGIFCRHANVNAMTDPSPGNPLKKETAKPFLEAGGVVIESLCWLSSRQKHRNPELNQWALQAARYSFAQRNEKTGLLRNQPVDKRWDYFASTTECGLWANSLLHAADSSGIEEFRTLARDATAAYLRHGFDEKAGRYFGQLEVETGAPIEPPAKRENRPAKYADPWETETCPTHNYPMQMAEACLTLFQKTGDPVFKEGAQRWVGHIRASLPANKGKGGYAEEYGQCIHFLVRASDVLKMPEARALAETIAEEAISHLYSPKHGMFRSHPGEDRADAIDGLGLLFLALMYLESGKEPDLMGFHF